MAVRITEQQLAQLLENQDGSGKPAKPFRLTEHPGPKESEIQSDIATFMRTRGAIGGKQIVGVVHPYKRPKVTMSGMPDGTPDTLWVDPEYGVIFVETKARRGRLSFKQELFRDAVLFCGGTWIMARSVSDLAKQLDRLEKRNHDISAWWRIRYRQPPR